MLQLGWEISCSLNKCCGWCKHTFQQFNKYITMSITTMFKKSPICNTAITYIKFWINCCNDLKNYNYIKPVFIIMTMWINHYQYNFHKKIILSQNKDLLYQGSFSSRGNIQQRMKITNNHQISQATESLSVSLQWTIALITTLPTEILILSFFFWKVVKNYFNKTKCISLIILMTKIFLKNNYVWCQLC